MTTQDLAFTLLIDQSPEEAFKAINNVRGWWSEGIEGSTEKLNDEFVYRYKDMHYSKQKLTEVIENKKVVWLVTDSYLSFLDKDKSEWTNTTVSFDISRQGDKTKVLFTHHGLTPAVECYSACSNGWNHYLQNSLLPLLTTGKGNPGKKEDTTFSVQEVAARFDELAQQEKWFDIQDELFADNVISLDPPGSPYFGYAEGKNAVRKKGEEWVKKITAAHYRHTTHPVVGGNHFAVGRNVDITVEGFGRVRIDEIMLYEVKDGKIVSEQFFYAV